MFIVRLAVIALLLPLPAFAGDVLQPTGENDVWSKYDFVPGTKLLFFEDFSKPDPKKGALSRFKAPSARLDIQEKNGAKWLRCRPPCTLDVILPEKLPDHFTVDFDMLSPTEATNGISNGLSFYAVNADGSLIDDHPTATSSPGTLAFANSGLGANNEIAGADRFDAQGLIHFSWSFDGKNVRGYVQQIAGLNSSDIAMPKSNRLRLEFSGGDDPTLIDFNVPVWVTNLRIASGGNPVSFAELSKKGRLSLPGILFDTGSDRIRSESTPTLTSVAKMLTEHPELSLTIEGHTDNQGTASGNQTLSDKRAAAVKAWLVAKHKVAVARLEPQGFGQTKPVGSNDTSEGRQANRRVEIVQRVAK